jgi:uridine kinase
VPSRTEPEQLAPIVKQEKLLNVYREHLKFLKISDLNNVGDLNKAKINGRISDVIQISEAYQAKQIGEIAAQFVKNMTKVCDSSSFQVHPRQEKRPFGNVSR